MHLTLFQQSLYSGQDKGEPGLFPRNNRYEEYTLDWLPEYCRTPSHTHSHLSEIYASLPTGLFFGMFWKKPENQIETHKDRVRTCMKLPHKQ